MGWLLLIITGIGALFAGLLRRTSRRPFESRYRDAMAGERPLESPEEEVLEGGLDVEEYKALHEPLQPTDNM